MAYIHIVNEDEARGTVAEDYAYLSASYSKILGPGTPTPQVYRPHSGVPAYFRFGAVQNRVLTNGGAHDLPSVDGVPNILVNFAVALHSSCFY
ncbi:MAG: hypothetical protein ABFS41_12655 [Myxococcota bacterium]